MTTRVARVCAQRRTWSASTLAGLGMLVLCAVLWVLPGHAFAAGPSVTIPSGPFTDQHTITVSGTGFPIHSTIPTGLQIIECSDPGGTTGNLPTDPTIGCDGSTVNGSQVNTDASGNFSTSYSMVLLNPSDSTINCDATDFCVLWVGQDFNNSFLSGPHGFSSAFEIASAPAQAIEAPLTIALPLIAAAIVGAFFILRRRRPGQPQSA